MKAETIIVVVTVIVCILLAIVNVNMQTPTVEMTSDAYGSKLVSTDYLGNKTTCTADVMPGGTIVSRCY